MAVKAWVLPTMTDAAPGVTAIDTKVGDAPE
jgi:hypothetical protein